MPRLKIMLDDEVILDREISSKGFINPMNVTGLDEQHLKKYNAIQNEIQSKPLTFTRKSNKRWDKSEMNTIEYIVSGKAPKSHRTIDYAKRKLARSESAIRNKLSSIGYRVVKGEICSA